LYNLAEMFGLIDWSELRVALQEHLASYETRQRLYTLIGELAANISTLARAESQLSSLLRELTDRTRDVLADGVGSFLKEHLPEMGNRLADSPSLWDWLAHEAVPSAKPQIIAWLEQEGGSIYLARQFDVATRVQEAIDDLQVEEVHRMVDAVSANELGAIQVLGFVLGAVAGGAMSLFLF
jgi:uncharacterized membrane protein YheB (UPF0754 family)